MCGAVDNTHLRRGLVNALGHETQRGQGRLRVSTVRSAPQRYVSQPSATQADVIEQDGERGQRVRAREVDHAMAHAAAEAEAVKRHAAAQLRAEAALAVERIDAVAEACTVPSA